MKLDFYCREEYCPMHYYEAMQVFAHALGMPELHPGSADVIDREVPSPDSLLTVTEEDGSVRKYPFFIDDARKSAYGEDRVIDLHRDLSNDRNLLKRYLYKILSGIYGRGSPWGVLTGVRPVKVLHNLIRYGLSEEDALSHFRDFFFVTDKKSALCLETLKNQFRFIGGDEPGCSFYVSIPFCPTICSYCTFGSSPIGRYSSRIDSYIDLLEKEIDFTAPLIAANVTEIYIGGGTPTSISAKQLERLLEILKRNFNISGLSEFCVEAGRPDTVDAEKLGVLKKYGVTRISINPQTMNDKTLAAIGRRHTSEQTVDAFGLARQAGFDNINMDVIAGLPGETATDFKRTMKEIRKLDPDGLTVHTLALKRASSLSRDEDMKKVVAVDETESMCDFGAATCASMGMKPFYLYRQKNCVGNNENVSYCKPGRESPYNIHIMEEDRTVFACGAGAVTKVVKNGGSVIERFFNTKSVDEYLVIGDEIIRRKRAALELFLGSGEKNDDVNGPHFVDTLS
ncbi:MAG: coproporphyrinogen dehydrogenase HemZ [Clostridia bacterium]|nr:coproporphyrinogen dehydrogenase HemZ [Clostridia bacterium]